MSGLFRPSLEPSPLPTLRSSLARGFITATAVPAILALPLILVPVVWLALVALGLQGPPGRMVAFLAIPPVSTYFDSLNAVSLFGFPAGLWASFAFLLVRSLLVAVLAGMIVEALGRGAVSVAGLARGLRAWPIVLAVNVLGLGIMLIGSVVLPILGPGFGFLGSILTLVAALYFFAYAPTAAVREARGLTETLRRSARAAMLPRGGHLTLSMLYVFLSLPLMVALAPEGSVVTVNPALAMWVYALLTNVSHTAFAAAFAYRYLVAEPLILGRPGGERR